MFGRLIATTILDPSEPQWMCDVCLECFALQISLLSHKVKAHRALDKRMKLSQLLWMDNAEQTDTLYSSDSDCDYQIVTRVIKIRKTKGIQHNDDLSPPSTNVPMTTSTGDRIDDGINDSSNDASPELITSNSLEVTQIPSIAAFICDYCAKVFQTKSRLRYHMRQAHLSTAAATATYICSKCGKKMFNETYRRNHERRCYTHLCSYCGKHFKSSTNLSVHIMSHTKERPFACHLCDKAFLIKRSLKDHMNKHADIKPYRCPYDNCDKSFTLNTGVRQHINTMHLAKRFVCSYCQAQFSTKCHMECHVRTHTGEKPFKCGECPATFRLPNTLKKHQRVHTGERPYECDICTKVALIFS